MSKIYSLSFRSYAALELPPGLLWYFTLYSKEEKVDKEKIYNAVDRLLAKVSISLIVRTVCKVPQRDRGLFRICPFSIVLSIAALRTYNIAVARSYWSTGL